MITDEDLENVFNSLAAAFPNDVVHWRIGSTDAKRNGGKPSKGKPLAYIDARDVMERLDEVVGPANWQNRYSHAEHKTACEIGIRVNGEWIWKADGAGDTDFEGNKGAFSDSFKRAAVRWGIGQYLYGIDAPWIPLDQWGKIPDAELKKLHALHSNAAQSVDWGNRSDQNTYRLLVSTLHHFASNEQEMQGWMDDNKGTMSQLPVRMKKALWEEIQRIIQNIQKAAA